MGNEFGKPEEEEDPVINFEGYTLEEINAKARLNREKLEKEFKRMKKKGQPGPSHPCPRHPFDCCSICSGYDHYTQDCASYQDMLEHAGSETESCSPMVCLLCYEFGDHLPENCPNPLDVSNILITGDSDSGPGSSESTTGHGSCPSTLDGNRHDDTTDIIVGTATGLPTSE